MEKDALIYVAGHNGMVGSAIVRRLQKEGYSNLLLRSSAEIDLRDQRVVNEFFAAEKPKYVFLAAAKVGGIAANDKYRAEFIYDNLMIEANVIHASYLNNVTKLLFLGSSCIYPKMALQPLKEEYILSGYLEHTNQPYAIAKIAGIEMCNAYREQYGCNFISAMPTNLYGSNDNYDPEKSHVLPALLRKFIVAQRNSDPLMTVWGSGEPRREFLYVDDLADACLFLMKSYNEKGLVNIGTGKDVTILELAQLIKEIVGYKGSISFDSTRPDGTPQKLLDSSKLEALGWKPITGLREGIEQVFEEVKERSW